MALLNWYNSCQDTSKLIRQNKYNIENNIQNMIDILTSTNYEFEYNDNQLSDQNQNQNQNRGYNKKQFLPRKPPPPIQLPTSSVDEFPEIRCSINGDSNSNGNANSETRGPFKMSRSHMKMPLTPPSPLSNCNGTNDVNFNFDPEIQLQEDMDQKYTSAHKIPYLWNGILPQPRNYRITTYSQKVFIGGIPWDMSEQSLNKLFEPFGRIRVEWPRRDKHAVQPKGYAYIIFEAETKVRELLAACTTSKFCSETAGNYYFHISSGRIRAKQVEIIPWTISDSNFVTSTHQKLNPSKTVFVGALHGKLTAEGLAKVMNDMFDGVVYAGIDTDKYKYPIGSGRVTFNNSRSYMKAVSAGFIKIKTTIFTKTIQVDPYLEDTLCALCGVQHGPYFCRELACFRYFCRTCWQWQHSFYDFKLHKPLTRSSRSDTLFGFDLPSP
ncbi:cytoplasmic polyadenylation element-binding protein 1-like [Eupeodes corollae]|uniref:cytoplasmic polyadenylation element-binding protein 1-like n=1 Tax=Eupeodes corollae TaxID=290404 RepID=UPI0024930CE1|nr:cytoplasmic polyadenylation element-binding protein 1-like [Eupeodes corollae]